MRFRFGLKLPVCVSLEENSMLVGQTEPDWLILLSGVRPLKAAEPCHTCTEKAPGLTRPRALPLARRSAPPGAVASLEAPGAWGMAWPTLGRGSEPTVIPPAAGKPTCGCRWVVKCVQSCQCLIPSQFTGNQVWATEKHQTFQRVCRPAGMGHSNVLSSVPSPASGSVDKSTSRGSLHQFFLLWKQLKYYSGRCNLILSDVDKESY